MKCVIYIVLSVKLYPNYSVRCICFTDIFEELKKVIIFNLQ